MATRRYDVNTNVKLLSTHKQFTGGLKTVDTDDSLKGFFLRDAENISLSEFGFIERRYGLVSDTDFSFTGNSVDKVQGYFEYKKAGGVKDELLFYGGRLYLNYEGGGWTQITALTFDGALQYMDTSHFITLGLNGTFDAPFDTGRDIEATRIQDYLYIFTGVFPLYYNGDGNIYPFPQYIPNFSELKNFSHNVLLPDLETLYETGKVVNSGGSGASIDGPEIVDVGWAPYFPYTKASGNIMTIDVEYNVPNVDPYYQNFYYFSTWASEVTDTPYPATFSSSSGVTYGIGGYMEMKPRLYYRIAGAGASDLEWVQIADKDISFTPRDNLAYRGTGQNTRFQVQIDEDGLLTKSGTVQASVPKNIRSELNGGVSISSSTDCTIGISSMPVGTFDIKVEFVFQYSGYSVTGATVATWNATGYPQPSPYRYEELEFAKTHEILYDVQFLPEALDMSGIVPEELWTCNRVLNHYGKLMAYGSTVNPERVFVSHPTYKEYFPEYFTMDFETDTDETIQAITPFMGILVVQSESYTWGLKGTDALVDARNPYSQFTISPLYGTIAPKSVRPVRNQLYFLSKEGLVSLNSLYAIDYQYNIKQLDKNIDNIVPLDEDAVAIQFDNQYWIHFPNSLDNMTLRYDVDKKAWVKDTYFQYSGLDGDQNPIESSTNFNGIHKYLRYDGQLVLLTQPLQLGGTGNYLIHKAIVDYSIPTDLGETPRTLFETSYLNQGHEFHPKKYLEAKFDFTIQNEYNYSSLPVRVENNVDTTEIVPFIATLQNVELQRNHTYTISTSSGLEFGVVLTTYDDNGDVVEVINDLEETFTLDNTEIAYADIQMTFAFERTGMTVVVHDTTYDNAVNFKTLVTSEERILNLNPEEYGDNYKSVDIELGTNFGEWTFGTDTFGNKITIVKTVKLSGKGYNIKVLFVDFTKSKWTLETLGTTYKLRKARS